MNSIDTKHLDAALWLHLRTHALGVWLIWLVLAGIGLVNIALLAIFDWSGGNNSGVLAALGAYTVVSAALAGGRGLGFAVMIGITRRRYFWAGLASAAIIALAWSALAVLLALVEGATGGWGVGMVYLRLDPDASPAPIAQFAVLASVLVGLHVVGWTFGVIHVRWGVAGVVVALVVLLGVVGTVVLARGAPRLAAVLPPGSGSDHPWIWAALAGLLALVIVLAAERLTRKASI